MPDWQSDLIRFRLCENERITEECSDIGWIYDQLVGASYCLNRIKNQYTSQISSRDYRNGESIQKILNIDDSDVSVKKFLRGLFLNSAINRIVWCNERILVLIIEAEEKNHGQKKESKNILWPDIINKCNGHYVKNLQKKCLRSVLCNLSNKDTNANEENILFILRDRVNRQKHWANKAAGRATGGDKQMNAPWEELCFSAQLKLVEHALQLMVDLLKEVAESLSP